MEKNVNSFCVGFDTCQMSNKELEIFIKTFLNFKPFECIISKADVDIRNKTGKTIFVCFFVSNRPAVYLDSLDGFASFAVDFSRVEILPTYERFLNLINTDLKYY